MDLARMIGIAALALALLAGCDDGGDYPALRVVEMTCNHFGYFGSPQGQEAILRWLTP